MTPNVLATKAALTPAAARVLELMLQGLNTKEIAATLLRSPKTISCHTQEVYRFYGVHTRAGLFAAAGRMPVVTIADQRRPTNDKIALLEARIIELELRLSEKRLIDEYTAVAELAADTPKAA